MIFCFFVFSIFECIPGLQNSSWSGTTEVTLKLLQSLVNGLLNKHRVSVGTCDGATSPCYTERQRRGRTRQRRSWEMKAKMDENGGGEKMKVAGQRKGRKEGKNERKRGGKKNRGGQANRRNLRSSALIRCRV